MKLSGGWIEAGMKPQLWSEDISVIAMVGIRIRKQIWQ